MVRFFFILTFTFIACNVLAQSFTIKTIKDSEKNMKFCAFDSTAKALVLLHHRSIGMVSKENTIHIREVKKIKYFESTKNPNIVLPYLRANNQQSIHSFEGWIHYTNSKGEWTKYKISKENRYDVQIDKYWNELRIALPPIQKGSVIAFRYEMLSRNYIELPTWNFQSKMPTLKSQLDIEMPKTMDYSFFLKGKRLKQKYDIQRGKSWTLHNLEAIQTEKLSRPFVDRTERIKIQLIGFSTKATMGDAVYRSILKNWSQVRSTYLNHISVQRILNRPALIENYIVDHQLKQADKIETIQKVMDFIYANFTVNNYAGIYPSNSVSGITKTNKGNAADINLFAIALLRSCGIEANPILISSFNKGKVDTAFPSLNQFDHVLVAVKEGLTYTLYNPSRNNTRFISPYLCNYKGALLTKDKLDWIRLSPYAKSLFKANIQFDISKAKATGTIELSGYFPSFKKWKEVQQPKELKKANKRKYHFSTPFTETEKNSPFLEIDLSKYTSFSYTNPLELRQHSRTATIHFPFPFEEIIVVQIKKGKNQSLLNQPVVINRIINNDTKLKYTIIETEKEITISYHFLLGTTHFSGKENDYLFHFFALRQKIFEEIIELDIRQ